MTTPSNLTTGALIKDEGDHGSDKGRKEEYKGMYGQELSDGVVKIGFDKVDRGCDIVVKGVDQVN
jgi:hypothetical protein